MMTNRARNKSSSKQVNRRSIGWRSWSSLRKAYVITAAALAFVIIGVVGVNVIGIGHAFDGCYATGNFNTTSAYFWDDFYIHTNPNKYSSVIGHLGAGCHTIGRYVGSDGSYHGGQEYCSNSAGRVDDGPYYNHWWIYFPDRGGWVNEVHAADGSNDHYSWPWSGPTFYNAYTGGCTNYN